MSIETKYRNKLTKEERLSKKQWIEALYESGTSIKSPAIVLVKHEVNVDIPFPAQAMFTVSKRNFKRAHDRNRVKRLMKEAYRKQKHLLYATLDSQQKKSTLMFIFTGKGIPNYPYVHGKISDLLSRYVLQLSNTESLPS